MTKVDTTLGSGALRRELYRARIPLTLQLPQTPLIVLNFAIARMWNWTLTGNALYVNCLHLLVSSSSSHLTTKLFTANLCLDLFGVEAVLAVTSEVTSFLVSIIFDNIFFSFVCL